MTFIKSRPQPVIVRVIIPFNSSCNLSYPSLFCHHYLPPVHPITKNGSVYGPRPKNNFLSLGWRQETVLSDSLELQDSKTLRRIAKGHGTPKNSQPTNFPQGLSGHVWPIVMGGFTYIRIYIRIPVIQGGMTIPIWSSHTPTPMYVWYTFFLNLLGL